MPKINDWLTEGEQTKFSPLVKKLANQLKGSDDYETAFNVLVWIKKNLKYIESWKWRERYLCKRTAEQIIKSRKSSGCGDKATVFAALLRANSIPVKYVIVIELDWLEKEMQYIWGHAFADVFLNGKWRVADPAVGNIGIGYNWASKKKFVIYKKCLDYTDAGIGSYKDMEEKFGIFKKKWRKRSINLSSRK